jgi:hypothetical protein
MPTHLTKDLIFLFGGVLLSFALESERSRLSGVISPGYLSLICLAILGAFTCGYLVFRHYHAILSAGGSAGGSSRRQAYDDLRASLSIGGKPALLYAKWLETCLHLVERFFGEARVTERSSLQQVIGLSQPAALWTAAALDRCILFAFIYPQALLFLGWLMSGHAGRAEIVLGLVSEADPLRRYIAIGALVASAVGYAKCCRIVSPDYGASQQPVPVRRLRFGLWLMTMVTAALITDIFPGRGPNAVGGAVIVSSSVIGAVASDVLIAMISGSVAALVGILLSLHFGPFSAGIAASLTCAAIGLGASAFGGKGSRWQRLRRRLRFSHLFWWIFLAISVVFYIGLARLLPRSGAWPVIGPILLFYGLLPALNAPFLWFSVGLTRALLWLGIERKGWWPYFYALVDAAIAVLVIVILVAVMVVAIQALNLMAVMGGGQAILPVVPLLDAVYDSLKQNSFEPEYWWAYTLLVSAMIPSLVNLTIGGFSLLRGIPIVSQHLYAYLPEGHAVATQDRNWISLVLAIQVTAGLCLGFVAQFILLPWWIFGYILPGLGFGVLKFALSAEAFDLPGRIFLTGNPQSH